MIHVPPVPYRQGELLMTATTLAWSDESRRIAQAHEERLVFANFGASDEGRGRELVAECANAATAAFIVSACNSHVHLLAALAEISRVVGLTGAERMTQSAIKDIADSALAKVGAA